MARLLTLGAQSNPVEKSDTSKVIITYKMKLMILEIYWYKIC
jgi:hypothetical protein